MIFCSSSPSWLKQSRRWLRPTSYQYLSVKWQVPLSAGASISLVRNGKNRSRQWVFLKAKHVHFKDGALCSSVYFVCVLSCFSCVWLFVTPWTVASQAPLSMRLSRQEYWSGLPCPPPGHISDPGIEPKFLMSASLAGNSLPLAVPGKPIYLYIEIYVLAVSCGLWDLSSLARVKLGAPEVEAWSPNH